MAGTRRLTRLIETADGLLDLPIGPLVIALSGGADSAALAYLVTLRGRGVRALHVDHRLPGSPGMRAAAEIIASRLNIPLEVVETELDSGPSPEGRARAARYRAFADSIKSKEQMLTAHTSDDNVETVLINLIRGTGPRGLAGIPRRRPPNIHRPLLEVSRSTTREIAHLAGLGFVDDPMNLDPGLTRNYLRSSVIPLLAQLNPGLTGAIGRMSAALRADTDFIDGLTSGVPVLTTPNGAQVPLGSLAAAPGPIADRVLLGMIAETIGEPGATAELLARVKEVVDGAARSNQLTGEVGVRREGPYLVIEGPAALDEVAALKGGETRHRGLVFEVAVREEPCRVAPLSRWQAIFPLGTGLTVGPAGVVHADGEPAWVPGEKRLPVAWYEPGTVGYLSVLAREETGWTSSP